jgi:hypothetical protein
VYPNYGGLSDDLQGSSRAPRGLACTSTECRRVTLLVLSPPVPWAAVRRKPSVKGRNRTNEPTDGFSLWSLGLSLSSCVSLLRFQVSQCSTPATILVSIEQCFDCPKICFSRRKGPLSCKERRKRLRPITAPLFCSEVCSLPTPLATESWFSQFTRVAASNP